MHHDARCNKLNKLQLNQSKALHLMNSHSSNKRFVFLFLYMRRKMPTVLNSTLQTHPKFRRLQQPNSCILVTAMVSKFHSLQRKYELWNHVESRQILHSPRCFGLKGRNVQRPCLRTYITRAQGVLRGQSETLA